MPHSFFKKIFTVMAIILLSQTVSAQKVNSITQVLWSRTVSSGIGAPALPSASSSAYTQAVVIDGIGTSDCTVGGGTNTVACISNGTIWKAINTGGTISTIPGPLTITNLALSGPGVVVDPSSVTGSGYLTVPTVTLSGGTCSTPPVINSNFAYNLTWFTVITAGVCSVPPTASIPTAASTGCVSRCVDATLVLALQGATVQASGTGLLSSVTNSGSGNPVLSYGASIYSANMYAPILQATGYNRYPSIYSWCNAINVAEPIFVYYGSGAGSVFYSPGSSTDTINFQPGITTAPTVSFSGASSGTSEAIQILSTTSNTMLFNPSVGTTYYVPQAAGLVWSLFNSGSLVLYSAQGGTGYPTAIVSGTCLVSAGVLVSGAASTCSVITNGLGGVNCTLTNNGGLYSVAPTVSISGFASGSGAQAGLAISTANNTSGSFWQSPGDYKFHLSTGRLGGTDLMTVDQTGNEVLYGGITAADVILNGSLVIAPLAAALTPGNGGTIGSFQSTQDYTNISINPGANVSGLILNTLGSTTNGLVMIISNISTTNSATFATQATSHILGATATNLVLGPVGVRPSTMMCIWDNGTTLFRCDYAYTIAPVAITVAAATWNANTCDVSATTVTMTGLTTASAFSAPSPTTDTSAVTGWGAHAGLTINMWPTANTLNYKVCNTTTANITSSGSVTFNIFAR